MTTAPGLPSLAEILDSDDPSLYDVVTMGRARKVACR